METLNAEGVDTLPPAPPGGPRRLLTSDNPWVQGLRYLMVGGFVTSCDFGIFFAGVFLAPGHYLTANLVGKATAGACGFVLHNYVTFGGRQRHGTGAQILRYCLLLGLNAGLSTVLVYLGASVLGLPPGWVKAGSEVVVIGNAYLMSRLVVFRRHSIGSANTCT